MARLNFPNQEREPFELEKDEIVLGRSAGVDVIIAGPTISRRHARIVKASRGYVLEDMNSKKGTFLNGKLLECSTVLKNGDEIEIEGQVIVINKISVWEFEEETLTSVVQPPCEDSYPIPERVAAEKFYEEGEIENDKAVKSDLADQINQADQEDTLQEEDIEGDREASENVSDDLTRGLIENTSQHHEVFSDDSDQKPLIEPGNIHCPECDTAYCIPEEKIKETGLLTRCAVCKALFRVFPEGRVELHKLQEREKTLNSFQQDSKVESVLSQGEEDDFGASHVDDDEVKEADRDTGEEIFDGGTVIVNIQDQIEPTDPALSPGAQAGINFDNEDELTVGEPEASPSPEPEGTQGDPVSLEPEDQEDGTVISAAASSVVGDVTLIGNKAVAARAPNLIVIQEGVENKSFRVPSGTFVAGRGQEASLQLSSEYISRKHVELHREGDTLSFQNLSRKNEIYLNGREAASGFLGPMDVLSVCDIQLLFVEAGGSVDQAAIDVAIKKGRPIPQKVRRLRKIIAGLLVVLLGLMVAYLITDKPEPPPPAAPTPDPAIAAKEIREKVQQAINHRDWNQADALLAKNKVFFEDHDDIKEQIDHELKNRETYIAIEDYVGRSKWEKAVSASKDIPSESVYSMLTRQLFLDRGKKEVERAVNDAKKMSRKRSSWEQALDTVNYALLIDPEHAEALKVQEKLSKKFARSGGGGKAGKVSPTQLGELKEPVGNAVSLFVSGDFDAAIQSLLKLKGTIGFEKAEESGVNSMLVNIGKVKRYYERGLTARNAGQMVEAVNNWEKVFAPAYRVAGGRIPVAIASLRNEITNYYLPQANKLKEQKQWRKAAKDYKRILLYSSSNPDALNALASFESTAQSLLAKAETLKSGEGGCAQAIPLFNQIMELTVQSNPTYQKAMKGAADCQK